MDFVVCGIKLLASIIKAKEGYDPIEEKEFSNQVFSIRPYGEFQFECGSFAANWNRNIERGFESDNISSGEFTQLMIKCLNSIGDNNVKEGFRYLA